MTSDNKVGFLDKYIAANINISAPEVYSEWKATTELVKSNAEYFLKNYNNNLSVQKIIEISEKDGTPDALMSFAIYLKAFFDSAEEKKVKIDTKLNKLLSSFCETARISRDKRIINVALEISKKYISIQKPD